MKIHDRIYGPGATHKAQVARLLAGGAKSNGFLVSVATAMSAKGFDGDHVNKYAENRIIPDAFLIDSDALTVYVYEVEVGHPLCENKIAIYKHLAFLLDDEGWLLHLISVDRFGRHICIAISLGDRAGADEGLTFSDPLAGPSPSFAMPASSAGVPASRN